MTSATARPNVTDCGIPGIKLVPYGIHLCHVYQERQELVDSLAPYFRAGLRQHERCLWLTAPPLPAAEARSEMARLLPAVDAVIERGDLRIIDAADWYGNGCSFTKSAAIERWLEEEEDALAQAYNGVRIAQNTSFLAPSDAAAWIEYEHAVTNALQERRIVALCSFDLRQWQATDIFDIIRVHHFTLDRPDDHWQVLEPRDHPERSVREETVV